MNVFKRIANMIKRSIGLNDNEFLEWLGIDKRINKESLSEVTYYVCLRILAETISKMPLKLYQTTDKGNIKAENAAYIKLATRPNDIMTPSSFWSAVVYNEKHYGNAYVWIRHKFVRKKYGGDNVIDFWIMPTQSVDVLIDDKGIFGGKGDIYYRYCDKYSGETYVFKSKDVLHFKNSFSFDGILGKSVRENLKNTLQGGINSQEFMEKLYKNGMTASMALNYTGDIDDKAMKKLRAKYEEYTSGAKNAGRIVPVPLGFKLEPLNVKLTDAQFFELKKYSSLQIAAAFGIKPNQINNYDKSSYSNSEMQQMAYYVDTALFNIKNYEEELNYKLLSDGEIEKGYFFKFNEKVILRVDSKSQAEILSKYVNNGIYTPNEARSVLDLPNEEGGDTLIVNGNYIPITMVGLQYKKNNNAKEEE